MVNSKLSLRKGATRKGSSGPQKVGGGGRLRVRIVRSIGAGRGTIAGRGGTLMNGSNWMSAYRLFMSTGTKIIPTAAGRIGDCQRQQSGRWRRAASQQQTVTALQNANAGIPGATTILSWNAQILIVALWDVSRSTRCPQVTVHSDAGK